MGGGIEVSESSCTAVQPHAALVSARHRRMHFFKPIMRGDVSTAFAATDKVMLTVHFVFKRRNAEVELGEDVGFFVSVVSNIWVCD